jgi:hypothetical protein
MQGTVVYIRPKVAGPYASRNYWLPFTDTEYGDITTSLFQISIHQ